jgi:hypothetical protein
MGRSSFAGDLLQRGRNSWHYRHAKFAIGCLGDRSVTCWGAIKLNRDNIYSATSFFKHDNFLKYQSFKNKQIFE